MTELLSQHQGGQTAKNMSNLAVIGAVDNLQNCQIWCRDSHYTPFC
jgi:hypothetical protein